MRQVLFLLALLVGCTDLQRSEPVPEPANAAPPGPPCVHETCSERPRWLRCEHNYGGHCSTYRIDYERHCVCDRWANAEPLR